ncbi:hypothetical protein [Candidatus Minimicrobia vallesae]|uniref:hypothetical protein n=1 Tax=Candidatus Minimicrobia vallesae TaxID=2841264 RepID=UPI001E4D6334|nr:hypothetical protein [Candidatus Minimicrobia vallesae]
MRGADNIRFQTATAFQSLFAAAAMYLILTAIFTRVMARVERKLKDDDDQRVKNLKKTFGIRIEFFVILMWKLKRARLWWWLARLVLASRHSCAA